VPVGLCVAPHGAMSTCNQSAALPVLDPSVLGCLREACGDDMIAEIVGLFVVDVPQRLSTLNAAIASTSAGHVSREAHGLKNSAVAVGALRMASICDAIEQAARAGSLTDAANQCARIEREFHGARQALAQGG
jgi:HPt (histidine-containing phosphotransfer) domain-containing protein